MKYSSALEYSMIALVVLSVAGKLATNTVDQTSDNIERTFASTVAQQLSRSGFSTTVEHWPIGVVAHARRGPCKLWVRDYTPHGTMRNVYEELAEPIGPLRYIYNGTSSNEPPKLGPMLRFFFHREMLRIGITTPRYPIYAVASSAGCERSSVAWPASIT